MNFREPSAADARKRRCTSAVVEALVSKDRVNRLPTSGTRSTVVAEGPRIARVIMTEVGDFPSTETLAVHLPQRLCPVMSYPQDRGIAIGRKRLRCVAHGFLRLLEGHSHVVTE